MFNRPISLGVITALLLAVTPTYGIIMHDAAQYDEAWLGEYYALGCEYDCVVALYGYDGSTWWGIGSGTVISPNHVIGAAHSALLNEGNLYERYGMVTGNHLINDWWAMYETTTVAVHPEYTDIAVSPDMAIWTFEDEIEDVTPASLYTGDDSDLLGSLIDLVGFGRYGYPSTGEIDKDGAKRGTSNLLTRIGWSAQGITDDQLVTKFCAPGDAGYQHLGGMGGGGDSGGAWFSEELSLEEPMLVAVHGFRNGTWNYGSAGGASVSQQYGWIHSVVVPEPSTIVMFVVGGAFLAVCRWRKRR